MRLLLAVSIVLLAAAEHAQAQPLPPGHLAEVERHGCGPVPMVLIPCMSCRWRSFDTFMQRNADAYTMYAVTLPGFGGAAVPDLPVNGAASIWHENALVALERLLETESLDSVVVVGHSFGALMALALAVRQPERIRALVLLDGSLTSDRAWFSDDPADRLADALAINADWEPRLADPDQWQSFNTPSITDPDRRLAYHGWFMATPPHVLLQYWRENAIRDYNLALAALSVPALDLQTISPGADVEAARSAYLDDLRRNGGTARIRTVFLEETRHYVMEERPLVVDRMIADFLAGR